MGIMTSGEDEADPWAHGRDLQQRMDKLGEATYVAWRGVSEDEESRVADLVGRVSQGEDAAGEELLAAMEDSSSHSALYAWPALYGWLLDPGAEGAPELDLVVDVLERLALRNEAHNLAVCDAPALLDLLRLHDQDMLSCFLLGLSCRSFRAGQGVPMLQGLAELLELPRAPKVRACVVLALAAWIRQGYVQDRGAVDAALGTLRRVCLDSDEVWLVRAMAGIKLADGRQDVVDRKIMEVLCQAVSHLGEVANQWNAVPGGRWGFDLFGGELEPACHLDEASWRDRLLSSSWFPTS